VNQALEQLEMGMELLGITGVEDMLQEDIASTIDTLRNAGICIWMLTGDKVETAQCIAISTGLKGPLQEMYVIQQIDDLMMLQNMLNLFSLRSNTILVIDGYSLAIALSQCLVQFLQVSCRAPAVICCRCSPT
jgi:phospholipid-translocating ATPase